MRRSIEEIDGQFKMTKEEKKQLRKVKETKSKNMTNEERINALKTLIKKEIVQCTGDQLFLIKKMPNQEQPMAIPLAVFLRKTGEEDDKTKVWLTTPTGVFLFECNEFYEFCLEKSKEMFLKNLDSMIKQQTAKSLTMGLI